MESMPAGPVSEPAEPEMAPMDDSGGQPASPEEQELYNRFVSRAMLLIYDKKMMPQVIEMLEGGGDPVQGLATTSATVIGRIATAADKAGQKLPGDVLMHAGKEIFEELADLSREAGVKDYSQDEDALEGALFRAMDEFRIMLQGAGRLNQQAAQADMAKLEQMDKEGKLESMLSGLAAEDARGKRAPADGEEAEPPPTRGLMRGMN